MKLVLQRAVGDCGISTIASLLELTYEDVYVASAALDRVRRGRSGITTVGLVALAKKLGALLVQRSWTVEGDEEGILAVKWKSPHEHPFPQHLVLVAGTYLVDTADGLLLPADEYLERERAVAGVFLELQ